MDYLTEGKSERRITIEKQLLDGAMSASQIASSVGVSRARVFAIKRKLNALRSDRTIIIEQMLKEGTHSISHIARVNNVDRKWVQLVRNRMLNENIDDGVASVIPDDQCTNKFSNVRSLTVRLTLPVFDALTEVVAIANRAEMQSAPAGEAEPITIEDYVEELIRTKAVELGLLRQRRSGC